MRKYVPISLTSNNLPLSPASLVFIAEMTARAFIVADSNKRRTLSRSDIARAIAKSDQFDFLIDILPREDPMPTAPSYNNAPGSSNKRGKKRDDEVCIFLHMSP